MMILSRIKHYWSDSIQRQLTLSFALVTVFIMLIFNFSIIVQEKSILQSQHQDHVFDLANSLAISSKAWVLSNDVVGLQQLIDGNNSANLNYAMIISPQGRVLATNISNSMGKYLSDQISINLLRNSGHQKHVQISNDQLLDVAVPIVVNFKHIGWVRLGWNRDKLNQQLLDISLRGFVSSVLAMGVSIFIAWLLAKYLTRKLHRVIYIANQVQDGKFNLRAPASGNDEVGLLATDINRMLDALQQANMRNHMLLNSIEDGIFGVDIHGITTFINPAGAKLLGYNMDELVGIKQHNLTHHTYPDGKPYPEHECRIYQSYKQGIQNRVTSEFFWRKDGSSFAVEYISAPMIEDGEITGAVVSFSDITTQKANEEMIWRQANYDHLTGLANRRFFQETLEQEIKKAERYGHQMALLLIDLDHFKEVNDSLGHNVGDALLKETANRLLSCLRSTDTVARLGGDEFTIILSALNSIDTIQKVTHSIHDALKKPFIINNHHVYTTASIGTTIYPQDGVASDILLMNADQAMYDAKKIGRNCSRFYTPVLQELVTRRMFLLNELRTALKEQQFSVHYQPIIHMPTGAIHKAEALIRWNHPTEGMISPMEFIPIAEESGLIIEIGNWVFHQAINQVRAWQKQFNSEFQISVNKSPVELQSNSELGNSSWLKMMDVIGVKGSDVTIEITEGVLMESSDKVTNRLLAFRDASIQVALDDFGTGYSSLAYLKKLDIDYLKIDQSFVQNLTHKSNDLALCEAIIVMAHTLGLIVIAEGIETHEQFALLNTAGCDYAQGYLFSKPLPADQFEDWVVNNRFTE